MRKKVVWTVTAGVLGILAGVMQGFSASKENACFGEERYTLSAPEGVESRRGPVEFPHHAHFEFACVRCHHTFDGTEPPTGCMVSGCHDATEAPPPLPGKSAAADMTYFKNAYHQTCWLGCHKEIKAKNLELQRAAAATGVKPKLAKTGPTTCNGCHGKPLQR